MNILTPLATAFILGAALTVGLDARPAAAQSPNDDNGHHGFVRQALPFVLGRRPRNTMEVNALADLAALRGREAVLRALMKRPEFLAYWTETMADIMRTQRTGSGDYEPACMNAPQRLAGEGGTVQGDGGALAEFVGSHPSQQFVAGEFNWYDVTYSSLELGNLVPAYRAYVYMRAFRGGGGDAESRERSAQFFLMELLNRNPGCMGCHLGNAAPQNTGSWNKQHPLHATLEGEAKISANLSAISPLFRGDLFVGSGDLSGYGPWGMNTACAELHNPGAAVWADEDLEVNVAGLQGTDVSVEDLADALMWGYDELDATEMPLDEGPSDAAAAFVYLLAAQVVNAVWENVMGAPLTLAHGYARNVHQRELHRFLLEDVFLAEHWSLQELLLEILLSPEFNRRAPVNSARPSPYQVVPVFDAMLPDQPCDVEPTPAFDGPGALSGARREPEPYRAMVAQSGSLAYAQPGAVIGEAAERVLALDPQAAGLVSGCTNGQGEIAHRHHPRTLLGSVAGAMGWRRPALIPDQDDYPSEDLMLELGQYLSRTRPGTSSVDFAAYLAFENAVGHCAASGKLAPGVTADWITRLIAARADFDSAHPDNPATVGNMVQAVKDRILQRPVFGAFDPDQGGDGGLASGDKVLAIPGGYAGPAELALMETYFGVPMNSDAQALSQGQLESKLRGVCGVYLTSPQFMMTAIDTGEEHNPPRLQACMPGEPCSYQAICNLYRGGLSNPQQLHCHASSVSETEGGILVVTPLPPPPPEPCLDCLKARNTAPSGGAVTPVSKMLSR